MKIIGFSGGSLISKLGSANDVEAFFSCIKKISTKEKKDWGLILNRLYRNYLKLDELDSALILMEEINCFFKKTESIIIDWDDLVSNETTLNIEKKHLSDVFEKYFISFSNVVEDAKFFYEDWKIYKAVKIVITDAPEYVMYQKLSLEEYDSIIGDPLWLRDANGDGLLIFNNGSAHLKTAPN